MFWYFLLTFVVGLVLGALLRNRFYHAGLAAAHDYSVIAQKAHLLAASEGHKWQLQVFKLERELATLTEKIKAKAKEAEQKVVDEIRKPFRRKK